MSVIIPFLIIFIRLALPDVSYVSFSGTAQGTTYQVKYRKAVAEVTRSQVDSILLQIDRSLSLWQPHSLINRFNRSTHGIEMDDHMKSVVSRAMEIADSSQGTFDITVKRLVDAWGFGVKKGSSFPSDKKLIDVLQCTGIPFLKVNGKKLYKSKKCVQIDCNGIAQGYSVDVIASFLEVHGIKDYLVELGGEIRILGLNQEGKPWKIGIESAISDLNGEHPVDIEFQPVSGGITTAGNYRKFRESGGHHFSHVIDPRTGRPVENGLISVTVMAINAMDADAWDDALMVLGLNKSFELLSRHPEIRAHFIYQDSKGIVRDTATAGFSKL